MMETQQIALSKLVLNTGQIPGLPANPRTWTADDVDSIGRSLVQTPELFEARPIIAVPYEGKLVILAGSLRFCGAKKAKMNKVPVYVLPEDMTPDKMQEIVIKDNGSFGSWDFDALANEWDDNPLTEWGVPAWDTEAAEKEEKQQDNKSDKQCKITITCEEGDTIIINGRELAEGDEITMTELKQLIYGKA